MDALAGELGLLKLGSNTAAAGFNEPRPRLPLMERE
jgi:hypothetical protein